MGQAISITESLEIDGVLIVTTDRSLTGQDGESYTGPVSAGAVNTFGAGVSVRLFAADPAIDHIYVMSNALSIRRRGGWDDQATATTLATISGFFRFYGASAAGDGQEVVSVAGEGEGPSE